MELVYLLGFVLSGSIVTYFSGDTYAKQGALIGSLVAICPLLFSAFSHGGFSEITYTHSWIHTPKIDFNLAYTGKSAIFVWLTLLIVPLVLFMSPVEKITNKKAFYALVLLMEFALLGAFLANDGMLFYIFWDLSLFPIYFIILFWGDENRKKSTLLFFLYTFFGSLFLLVALMMVQYYPSLAALYPVVVFVCFYIPFAIKIPIFPFHSWQVNVYKSAPMVGSILLSALMLKMGFWGFYRWMIPNVPDFFSCPVNQNWILTLALIGVIYGALLAIKQNDLKKLLAYSSFSHVGLITMGVFVFNASAQDGFFVQSFAHGINVAALFYMVQIIYNRTQTFNLKELGGIWQKAPVFSAFSLILVLAAVAFPLTNAFVGEFLLLNGIFEFNEIFAVIASLSVVLGVVYMLRLYKRAYLGMPVSATENFKDLSFGECAIFIVLISIIFITGIYPSVLLTIISK